MFFNKVLIILLFLIPLKASAEITDKEVSNFLQQLSNAMNNRDVAELTKFYKFYTTSNARFIKQNYLVDLDDPEKEVGEERFDMNTDEYLVYLKRILTSPKRYAYYQRSMKIHKDKKNSNSAIVELSIEEMGIRDVYNDKKGVVEEIQFITNANCNMGLIEQNSRLIIQGMNCIEKITKRATDNN